MRSLVCTLFCLIFLSAFANAAVEKTFSVLQFNVWQLKVLNLEISKARKERLKILPEMLESTGADVIALEDIWKDSSKKYVIEEMSKKGYPYYSYTDRFWSQGDGLLIVSKFRISSPTDSPPFRHHTRFDEKFTRKRLKHVVLELPNGREADFFITHMGAITFSEKDDEYSPKEKLNLYDQVIKLTDWMKALRKTDIMIMAGDFNLHYQKYDANGLFRPFYSEDYLRLIRNNCYDGSDLVNSFLEANNMNEASACVPTYSRDNPYVSDGMFANQPSEVEDYIFYCKNPGIQAIESKIVFRDPIPEEMKTKYALKRLPLRLSDHYGVLTKFKLSDD